LLHRLSIFAGGWALEAAEEVCVGDGVESYDMLDLLTQVVNKSLVVVMEHSPSRETRYRMLETIRQYAREKLLEAGGSESIRDQHLAYFVKLVEQAEPELYRSNQVFWLNKLDDEIDNLRMAMEWALAKDLKAGLQLIVAGGFFWEARGDIREIASWLAQLLEQYNHGDSLRARALVIYGSLLQTRGELAQAQILITQGLELSRAISDKHAEAFSLWGLAGAIVLQGDVERGISFAEQSLAMYTSLGDRLGQANTTRFLSVNHNDLERSKSFVFESLGLYRELGNPAGIAFCLDLLALRAMWGGDFSSSAQWLDEAMAIHRQLGNLAEETWALANYGRLSFWQGDYQKACTYYEEVLALAEKVGEYLLSIWTRANLSYAILRQGDLQKAKEMFGLCIQQFQKANILIGVVYAIEGLASLKIQQGQVENAVQLYAWTDGMREKMGDQRPPIEQGSVEKDLAAIHAKINDTEFTRLSAEGRTMAVEQAIALALEE